MKNKQLEDIINNVSKKSNKELSSEILTIKIDFDNIKNTTLDLADTLNELKITYDVIYNELQNRLKFEDKNESGL